MVAVWETEQPNVSWALGSSSPIPQRHFFSPNSIKELVISEGGPDGPNYTNLSVGGWKEELAIWFKPIVILWQV